MILRFRPLAMALTLLAAVAAHADEQPASPPPPGVTVQDTKAGPVFATDKGLSLYTFDKDAAPGQSACNGKCAEWWIPFPAPADAQPSGSWGVIHREDGGAQWTYRDKPLYSFHPFDINPGDVNGDNVGGIWHLARP